MGNAQLDSKKKIYTVAEYMEILAASETRVEYLNGFIRAMASGTINHSLITSNVNRALGNKLDGKGCRTFSESLKVHVAKKNSYVLPDTTVICGKPEISEQDKNSVINPTLIVEVLSKSTRNYDCLDKFSLYRSIASLKEYVLVDSEAKKVEVFTRKDGQHIWQIKTYSDEDKLINLESINVVVNIDELYEGVDFENE